MTDDRGTFEHALFDEPRHEHGFCTDDMARVLLVATRQRGAEPAVRDLAGISLKFLHDAQDAHGMFHNRMHRNGHWEDRPSTDDCWGRSVWGLGTAVAHSDDGDQCAQASAMVERAVRRRSPWSRAMAFAAVGTAELLAVQPEKHLVRAFLVDAAKGMARPGNDAAWPWPEARLSYANAILPEAMIAAGTALIQPDLVRQGLDLLGWLLTHEMQHDHLSVTPVGGAGPGDHGPAFDQQPIEVAALADACARAAAVDDDPCWLDGIDSAVNWFLGDNDGQVAMWQAATGGGYDGLTPSGPNLNQGAESTLAVLTTLQQAQRLVTAAP